MGLFVKRGVQKGCSSGADQLPQLQSRRQDQNESGWVSLLLMLFFLYNSVSFLHFAFSVDGNGLFFWYKMLIGKWVCAEAQVVESPTEIKKPAERYIFCTLLIFLSPCLCGVYGIFVSDIS